MGPRLRAHMKGPCSYPESASVSGLQGFIEAQEVQGLGMKGLLASRALVQGLGFRV